MRAGAQVGFSATCSFATSDGLLAGVVAATRNSARFSALVFALAARAGRPLMLATNQTELALAFVAAHGIHYATVAARAAIESGNQLRHPSLEPLVVVAAGAGLLALLAFTARARSVFAARAHAIAFYVAGALFAAALGSRARSHAASAAALIALAIAFVWRVVSALLPRRSESFLGAPRAESDPELGH